MKLIELLEDTTPEYAVGDKVLTLVGGKWLQAIITKPKNDAGNYGVRFKVGTRTMNYVSSPEQLKRQ